MKKSASSQTKHLLLGDPGLRAIQRASPAAILSDLKSLIEEAKLVIQQAARHADTPTWETHIQPIEEVSQRLSTAWGRVHHLKRVVSTPALQRLVEQGTNLTMTYSAWYARQRGLYDNLLRIRKRAQFRHYTLAQRRTIDLYIRQFQLVGIELPSAKQRIFQANRKAIVRDSHRFAKNVLAATAAGLLHVTDEKQIAGIPQRILQVAAQRAKKKGKRGWIFSIQSPEYSQIMQSAQHRDTRRALFHRMEPRASERGPATQDNTEIIRDILKRRAQQAHLLGYRSFAHLSTAFKMARTPSHAMRLLKQLMVVAADQAKQEMQILQREATALGLEKMESWDVDYVAERLSKKKFGLNQESLRPYFPLSAVWDVLTATIHLVTGLRLVRVPGRQLYHPSVQLYAVYGPRHVLRGHLLVDLFARPSKQGGAWCGGDMSRGIMGGTLQLPLVRLVTNISPVAGRGEAHLSPGEIVTLFHECGHAVHHFLSEIDVHTVSENSSVERDAVEIPSQWFERYAEEPDVLQRIAIRAGKRLPAAMLKELQRASEWLGGMRLLRQTRFGLFDMSVHLSSGKSALRVWHEVASLYPFPPVRPENRFPHVFSHIFEGGYAAGYYSYLWSELYSNLIFSRGRHSRSFLKKFVQQVLTRGGERPSSEVYQDTLPGRPALGPLLKGYGISTKKAA